jgi:hypothetical protein
MTRDTDTNSGEEAAIILARRAEAARQMRLLSNEIRSRPASSSPSYDLARIADALAVLFEVMQ